METTSPQWCHHCCRFISVWPDSVVCPDCGGCFLDPPSLAAPESRRRRFPPATIDEAAAFGQPRQPSEIRFRRGSRASAGDRSPFNPVIVLRGPPEGGRRDADRTTSSSFELYYDDGAGSGLRPLPESMSDFLMGSGFERLLEQLAQIEVNGIGGGRGSEYPPASKAAIESMPITEITDGHVAMESHCAVCKEPFELGAEAREMPCKHLYHQDCILPWLALRNSCPVCRHEMPTDVQEPEVDGQAHVNGDDEEMVGLTIWRLPGGGFAVGRFTGGRRAGERELPVVYTEMDGGFNTSGVPRRISWSLRGSRSHRSGGIGQAFRNFFSFFRRMRPTPSTFSSRSSSESRSSSSPSFRQRRYSLFSRSSRRRSRNWSLEDGNVSAIARW
ncbi:E3 ubiquitin-protein ligase [Canna indica]|uniref:RING-type E3 ubiquitin transferase n=1 Tax=Canna indica TaxID=4628 RepID=A0AAQ3K4Y9_9LILI|nr:E3 ubiquitin-protein ligase [Canna indica]